MILSPDDFESLEETLETLSDPKAMPDIRNAEAELDEGRTVNAGELQAKYLKR